MIASMALSHTSLRPWLSPTTANDSPDRPKIAPALDTGKALANGKGPAKSPKGADKKTYVQPPTPRGFTMEPILPSVWKNPAVIALIVALVISAMLNLVLVLF